MLHLGLSQNLAIAPIFKTPPFFFKKDNYMQCFSNLWVDICLGNIFLLHLLSLFFGRGLWQRIFTALLLLYHGALMILMLVLQLPLEELLMLVLASALLGLGMAYVKERGSKR